MKNEKLEKLLDTSQKICKVIKVLCIIGIVCISIAFLACTVVYFIPNVGKIITENEDLVSLISTMDSGKAIIDLLNDETVVKSALKASIEEFGNALVKTILCLVLISFYTRFVNKIKGKENIFDASLLNDFKMIFIILVIMIAISSLFVGFLAAVIFYVIYNLYKHGCELQKESDETI